MAKEMGIAGIDRAVASRRRAARTASRPCRRAPRTWSKNAAHAGRAARRRSTGRYSGVGRISGVSPTGPNCADQPFEGGELEFELVLVDRQARAEQREHQSAPAAAEIFRHAGIMAADAVPGLLGGLAIGEQLEVVGRDHAFLDQRLEIDHPLPEFAAEEQDRHRLDLAGLDQGQQLERLVERAEAAREDRHRARAQQEVHLPQREIVELEAERGRDIGVGQLLVRQHDVEADRFRALVAGAAIGRLHDRRAAARADDELPLAVLVGLDPAGQPGELARLVIIFATWP